MYKSSSKNGAYYDQIVIGLFIVLIGGVLYMKALHTKTNGLHAEGQIIDQVKVFHLLGRSAYCYSPIVLFTDKNQNKIRFQEPNLCESIRLPSQFQVGTTVPIIYFSDDPKSTAQINGSSIFQNAYISGITGFLLIVGALMGICLKNGKNSA